MLRTLVAAVLITAAFSQTDPNEPARTPVLQNKTVAVTQLHFAPGTRETTHTHPFPLVLVQLTPGEVDVRERDAAKHGNRPGEVWFIAADQPHAVTPRGNRGEAADMLAIALLPTREPALGVQAPDAPALRQP